MNGALLSQLKDCQAKEELVALATVVAGVGLGNQVLVWPGGQTLGDLGAPRLNQRAALYAEQIIPSFGSSRKHFQHEGEPVDVFFQVYPPAPCLVLVGAVDRDRELGMSTTVGRLRTDAVLENGLKYMLVTHNTQMGAARGAILVAELLQAKKYI